LLMAWKRKSEKARCHTLRKSGWITKVGGNRGGAKNYPVLL